jgi:hypothetical protein
MNELNEKEYVFTYSLDGEDHNFMITADQVRLLSALLAVLRPIVPASVSQGRGASVAPAAERGPVGISGITVDKTKRDGTPMASPKFTVMFEDGKKFSTFDANVSNAAKTLWGMGRQVFYTTVKKGDFENLSTVRSADGAP